MPPVVPGAVQPLRVAVGVIRNAAGEILVARRHAHLHQGGLWEFPGGKIDDGEDSRDALRRELDEELALRVEQAEPFIVVEHAYADKAVRLEVWRVTAWSGQPHGVEGQPLRWLAPQALDPQEFPAANRPIIAALQRVGE